MITPEHITKLLTTDQSSPNFNYNRAILPDGTRLQYFPTEKTIYAIPKRTERINPQCITNLKYIFTEVMKYNLIKDWWEGNNYCLTIRKPANHQEFISLLFKQITQQIPSPFSKTW